MTHIDSVSPVFFFYYSLFCWAGMVKLFHKNVLLSMKNLNIVWFYCFVIREVERKTFRGGGRKENFFFFLNILLCYTSNCFNIVDPTENWYTIKCTYLVILFISCFNAWNFVHQTSSFHRTVGFPTFRLIGIQFN